MILLFEEYQYTTAADIALIKQCVDKAYLTENDNYVKIGCVGYFYCTHPDVNDAVFVLPKVLIDEKGLAFGKIEPEKIIRLDSFSDKSLDQEKETIFELSAWFYQAIAHFVEEHKDTDIVKMSNVQEVASAKGEKCQTYIDIILQLQKFQKEHRHLARFLILYNFENPSEYKVYHLDNKQWVYKLEEEKYPNPKDAKYLLYGLTGEPMQLDVDVQKILAAKGVKKGSSLEGAPVYLTGKELQEILQ